MYFSRRKSYEVILYLLPSSQKSIGYRKAEGINSSQKRPRCTIIESGDYFEVVVFAFYSKQICKVKSSKYSHFSMNRNKIYNTRKVEG